MTHPVFLSYRRDDMHSLINNYTFFNQFTIVFAMRNDCITIV